MRSEIALIALMLAAAPSALAGDRPFDWDRYHDRQDACRELDQALLDRLQRQCAAFGPLG
jgi:hypothetical protein